MSANTGSGAGEARPIAGGQSLVPMLAFRLAEPPMLIDLRKVSGMDTIAITDNGVSLGAKVCWCDIENDRRLAVAHPLLAAAVSHIAHYPIRNRGTAGGSLAHADPAAELPGVAVTCDAKIVVASAARTRVIVAKDFFLGPMMTSLAPDELIIEFRLPAWRVERRWAFEEFSRQRGGFALAGVAVCYDERDGVASDVRIGVIGASSIPRRIAEGEAALNGRVVDEQSIVAAAHAVAAAVDPVDDLDASAAYRRALVGTLTERALRCAAGREL